MANQFNSRNIIVGAAAVFLSTDDSLSDDWDTVALPARVSGVPYADTLNNNADWRSAGYTSNGVEYMYSPNYGEVEVDQLLDAAKLFKQKMTASVKTEFTEATLENLLVVWAQAGASLRSSLGDTTAVDSTGRTVDQTKDFDGVAVPVNDQVLGMEAGALGIEPVERQAVFVGGAPRTAANKKRERIYRLRRVISVDPSTHGLKRNDSTRFPVNFRLLPSEVSGAEYGEIRDRVITP
jgi:hypothetical protein